MKENSPVSQLGNFVDRPWGVSEIGGIDAMGSVLLSVGIVTAGAAVFEPAGTLGPSEAMGRDLFVEQGGK